MAVNNTFIYSPACPRCIRLAVWLKGRSEGNLSILPYSDPGAMALHPDLNFVRATRAPQLVHESGQLFEGAEAVTKAMALKPGWGWVGTAFSFPLLKPLALILYWFFRFRETACDAC